MERLDEFAQVLKPGWHMRIPKSRVRDPGSDGWSEALLYMPMKGSVRSFRKGCMHIHDIEGDDCWDLHMDKVDPGKDPIGHLLNDAPVLVAGAALLAAIALLMARAKIGMI